MGVVHEEAFFEADGRSVGLFVVRDVHHLARLHNEDGVGTVVVVLPVHHCDAATRRHPGHLVEIVPLRTCGRLTVVGKHILQIVHRKTHFLIFGEKAINFQFGIIQFISRTSSNFATMQR